MAQAPAAVHATFEIPEHYRTNTGHPHRKVLMWTFLASECMFFAALFSTHFIYRTHHAVGPGPEEVFSSIRLVTLLAFVLIISSFTMVLALAAAKRGDEKGMVTWLFATVFFGLFFIAGQGFEFYSFVVHEHLTPRTNLFAASFLLLTGIHGLHVTIGIVWLIGAAFLVKLHPPSHGEPGRRTLIQRVTRQVSGMPARRDEQQVEVKPRHRRFTAFTSLAAPPPPPAPGDAATLALQKWEEERLQSEKALNIELVGLYWHFVDIVFVIIFAAVYLLR